MRFIIRIGMAVAMMAGLASLVSAASATDMDTCFDQQGDQAIAACTRLINSGKYKGRDLASIYGARAVNLKVTGETDRAIADYDKAIGIEPTALRYSNRANALRVKGEIDRALDDLGRALRLDPKRATAFVVRGLIWAEEKNDPDRAIVDYTKAIEIDPMFTSAYVYRGQMYEKNGARELAKADYNKSLALPEKYTDGKWAHDEARDRLKALGAEGPAGK
jgi:tetratricopeptide (TPR) repeat protein